MVYNGYYKVMSNIPKMGQLPTPVKNQQKNIILAGDLSRISMDLPTDRARVAGSGRQGRRSGALRRDLRQLGEALVAAQWADQHQAFLRSRWLP